MSEILLSVKSTGKSTRLLFLCYDVIDMMRSEKWARKRSSWCEIIMQDGFVADKADYTTGDNCKT